MSGQINDEFLYKNRKYDVSAIEFPETFFDIYSLGINPIEFHTACWRGYVATFAIKDDKLILKKLYTNNGNKIENEAPAINGKLPKINIPKRLADGYKNSWREFTYENVDLAIDYTGSILITNDFIDDMYVHMGFQSPISYRNVIQLSFNTGQLVSSNDLSDIVASIRDNKIDLAEKSMKELDLIQWINDCFNISYFKKAKIFMNKEQK